MQLQISFLAIWQAKNPSDPPVKTIINNGFFKSSQINTMMNLQENKEHSEKELSEDRNLTR